MRVLASCSRLTFEMSLTDMPIPQDVTDILSEFGLPAGTIGIAYGLVRAAEAFERDASEPALNGWTVYLDFNNNNALDLDEPSVVSIRHEGGPHGNIGGYLGHAP